MRKAIAAGTLLAALVWPYMGSAHVQNERSLYEDIRFSAAQKEIVYLRGISAIAAPETGPQLFRPDAKLQRAELAYWAGLFKTPGDERESAEPADIRKAAIDRKLVDSLQGDATYRDVSQAYFDGALALKTPDETMTHEQFVIFLASYLNRNPDGPTLLDMAGAVKGPIGLVEKVERRRVMHDGEEANLYFMTVGGKEYAVASHPKMLYGPTDLTLWQGKTIDDSWLLDHDGTSAITIAAVPFGAFSESQLAAGRKEHGHGKAPDAVAVAHESAEPQSWISSLVLPAAGLASLLAIGVWLFWRRREQA